ncbi:MAG: hypothetical protein Q9204_006288, partial [Flavoplaca sp. TL-2023a]
TPIKIQRRFLWAYFEDSLYTPPDVIDPNYGDTSVVKSRSCPESCIKVIFDEPDDRNENEYDPYMTAGTIIRTEKTEPTMFSDPPVFRGRHVLAEVNTNLIRQWVHSCNSRHDACRSPVLKTSRDKNIRLIDVQESRIISATLVEKYVALSYVWGPATKPSLTRETLSQHFCPGKLKDLMIPRTISDAIQLVKTIGKRYLWVDSMCIVQDDDNDKKEQLTIMGSIYDNDKKEQLTIMGSIYANAEFVLVAAAGGDANAGLPGIGHTPRGISGRSEEIDGAEFMTAQAAVQQVLDTSVWKSRGWTFQEVILSRRALVFTKNLVYWGCQQATWREDIFGKPNGISLDLTATTSLWPHMHVSGTMCRTSMYCQLAREFSGRQLKEEKDVIWAFIGILQFQTPRFRKGFIWGLPYERLDATLLWSDSGCRNVHSRNACHSMSRKNSVYELSYPSWSWLSTNLPISFIDECGDSIVSEVTWHEPLKLGDDKSAIYPEFISWMGVADSRKDKLNAGFLFGSTSESHIMDYGLLHFTAQTAVLALRWKKEWSDSSDTSEEGGHKTDRDEEDGHETDSDEVEDSKNYWVRAIIHSPNGKRIGMLSVPSLFFDKKSERSGEFVLLSSNAEKIPSEECKEVSGELDCGTINHVNGCRHIQSRNVMLIEYDNNIAYRRALGVVQKEDLEDVETQTKTLVLG